ncbi:MAG: DUF2474 domain-containing protein [Parvibaculaceae bacterium]
MADDRPRLLLMRLVWFAVLWVAGIAVVGAVAYVIRLMIL